MNAEHEALINEARHLRANYRNVHELLVMNRRLADALTVAEATITALQHDLDRARAALNAEVQTSNTDHAGLITELRDDDANLEGLEEGTLDVLALFSKAADALERAQRPNPLEAPPHYHCSAGCEKADMAPRVCATCGAPFVPCTPDVCDEANVAAEIMGTATQAQEARPDGCEHPPGAQDVPVSSAPILAEVVQALEDTIEALAIDGHEPGQSPRCPQCVAMTDAADLLARLKASGAAG